MAQPTDIDDEVRAEFLTEAGELLEQLGTQLMQLEAEPANSAVLNGVFRAFHTVKGGAGFLALTPMVALCHAAEDAFGRVREGRQAVDAVLMDASLAALDALTAMLTQVAQGQICTAAPAELLARFQPIAEKPLAAAEGTISDDEFEALLDALHGPGVIGTQAVVADEPAPVASSAPAAPVLAAETTVRIDTQRLDQMMNLIGELVLVRNRLKTMTAAGAPAAEMARPVGELDHITRSLQTAVMRLRMQAIRKVFSRFPRLAREVARGLGKQVEVELLGESTDLDKSLVEALADPLVHMVRNSVDHGIELPAVRLAAGKPAAGRLQLAAGQQGDHIHISVRDDGAGMNPERLREKAVQKGLLSASAAASLSASECLQLVFMPGFSTKDQVSDLSGRGVGMDVVKSRITALNGSVMVESEPGQGSCIHLRVPLTLAILPALMVVVGDRQLALPLAEVRDVFALEPSRLRQLDTWQAVLYRRQTLRLVDLEHWAGVPAATGTRHVVVAGVDGELFGFIVGQVRAREEVVIKPLGLGLRGLAGLAGATVTGEGKVALIVDFPGVVRAYSATRAQQD